MSNEERDKAASIYSAGFSLTMVKRSPYTDELAFKAGWSARNEEIASLKKDLATVTAQRDRNIGVATSEGRYRDLYRNLCSRIAEWLEGYFSEELEEFTQKWFQDYEHIINEEKP